MITTPAVTTCKSLKFLYYNARSLLFKFDELVAQTSCHSPDIICIVETWLCKDILDSELALDKYHLVCLDRNRHGGGVAFFIKHCIPFTIIKQVPELEFCAINLHCNTGNACIALSYRPPSVLPQQYFEALDNTLLMVNQISNFSSLFLVGDLNINTSASDFPQ